MIYSVCLNASYAQELEKSLEIIHHEVPRGWDWPKILSIPLSLYLLDKEDRVVESRVHVFSFLCIPSWHPPSSMVNAALPSPGLAELIKSPDLF